METILLIAGEIMLAGVVFLYYRMAKAPYNWQLWYRNNGKLGNYDKEYQDKFMSKNFLLDQKFFIAVMIAAPIIYAIFKYAPEYAVIALIFAAILIVGGYLFALYNLRKNFFSVQK